jgi:MFS family permease
MRHHGIFSFLAASVAFVLTFVTFFLVFCYWAAWRYPPNNSMAGLDAFFYGVPIGVAFGIIVGFVKPRVVHPTRTGHGHKL